jgi:hypothetical protein
MCPWLLVSSIQGNHVSFKNMNNIFFEPFVSILIIAEVILLLVSLFHTDEFHKVIRNSSFIISAILIRILLCEWHRKYLAHCFSRSIRTRHDFHAQQIRKNTGRRSKINHKLQNQEICFQTKHSSLQNVIRTSTTKYDNTH